MATDFILARNRGKAVMAMLMAGQLLLLGYQVRRPDAHGLSLLRVWAMRAIVPAEKVSERAIGGSRNLYLNYLDLVHVRRQNNELKSQVGSMQVEIEQLRSSVRDLPRLDALLSLQHAYNLKTVAAQVVGTGTSTDAQVVYINRGSEAGIWRNDPVMVPSGVVGKISDVRNGYAQVLLLTDLQSGAGVLIGDAGVHGILKGLGVGRAEIDLVVDDENIKAGDTVITSGDDRVYPKGLLIGTVVKATPGPIFQNVAIKLAADLGALEELLIVTGAVPAPPPPAQPGVTAAQLRQAQLPSLPAKDAKSTAAPAATGAGAARLSNTPPAEGDALAPVSAPVLVPKAAPKVADPVKPPGSGGEG